VVWDGKTADQLGKIAGPSNMADGGHVIFAGKLLTSDEKGSQAHSRWRMEVM